MPIILLAGNIMSPNYQEARLALSDIVELDASLKAEYIGKLELDWESYLEKKKRELGGKAFEHSPTDCMVIHSSLGYIGTTDDLIKWAGSKYGFEDLRSNDQYNLIREQFPIICEEQLSVMVQDNESKYAVMTFDISGESQDEKEVQARAAQESVLPNTVIFELFYKECPKTCDNFLALCQGDGETKKHSDSQLNYLNTPIHRIVKDAWIQGGDVVSGSGSNGRSIYGAPFADESFTKQHDQAGRLAMANNGPHSNTSQFYVTLRPLPFLDSNKVVFGQVVSGMSVVRRINATPTRNQRPVSPVVVSACGEYEQKISSENAAVASFTRATGKKKNSQVNQSPRKSAGEVERQQATLVVLGLDNAGKSTIGAVYNGEPDKMVMPTWGFEFEKFSYDNHQITLYGLGGGAKIRAIWPNYYDDVHGIVFVVDASDADRMNEAKQTLHAAVNDHRVMGKPVLILANKQDLKGALSATEIAMRLEVDKLEALSPVLILKSIAKCSEFKSRVHDVDPSLYEGMDWMLEEVSDQYSELNERIARDKKIRIEQERKKKAIAAEIRAKEKAEEAASDLLAQFDY